MLERIAQWDRRAMLRVQRGRNPVLTAFFRPLTWTAWGGTWAILVLASLACVKLGIFSADRAFIVGILRACAGPGVSWIFVWLAKRRWGRKRPFEALERYPALTRAPKGESFPSGHSAAAFSFFAGLLVQGHPAAPAAGAWAILVAYSRVYLGVHFVSDVLVGAAFGTVLGAALAPLSF